MRSLIRNSLVITALGILVYGVVLATTMRAGFSRALASISPGQYMVVLALSVFNYGARFLRWRLYLGGLGHKVPDLISLPAYLGGFCFTVSPGKVGEGVRLLLYRDHGVPLGTTASLMLLERILDTASLAILACVLALALPDYRWIIAVSWALAAGGLFLLSRPRTIERVLDRTRHRLPRLAVRAGDALIRSLHSLVTILSWRSIGIGVAIGIAAWLAEGIGFALLARWMIGNIGFSYGIGAYAIATLAGAVSMLPGGLGSTEGVMTALLVLAGASSQPALLVTLLCRAATLWFAVLIGVIAILIIWRGGRWRNAVASQ